MREANDPADLQTLYDLYTVTGERQGFLIRPLDYYQRAWADFIAAGLAQAFIAEWEGQALADFFNPDRIVVGGAHEAVDVVAKCYTTLTQKGIPLLRCGVNTSETIKYASNAFLATKLTFINEIANLTETVGCIAIEIRADRIAISLAQKPGIRTRRYFERQDEGSGGRLFLPLRFFHGVCSDIGRSWRYWQ